MATPTLPTRVVYDYGDQLAGLHVPREILVAGHPETAALYDGKPGGASCSPYGTRAQRVPW